MTWPARLRSWLRAATHRGDLERRMQQEMQTHLSLREADLRRRGLSAADARRQARAGEEVKSKGLNELRRQFSEPLEIALRYE